MTFQFLILFFNPQSICTTQDDADVNFSSATGGYCGSGLVVADQVLGDHAATYDGGTSCGVGGFLLPEVSILLYITTYIMLITSSSASTSTHSTSCTISFFYKHNMFRLWQSNMVTWWK